MASSVLRGQTALCKLPSAPHISESEEETITTYSLPVQLKIGNNVQRKGTASGVLGSGMDVFKVSKVSLTAVIIFLLLLLDLDLDAHPLYSHAFLLQYRT